MRFYEFAPVQQPSRKPAPVIAADVKRGRLRRALARDIANSATKLTPSNDDLAIAFTRYGQAQRAVDDAGEQSGDYKAKPFTG